MTATNVRARAGLLALALTLVVLAGGGAATAQDAGVALKAVRDAARDGWNVADAGLREARRLAAAARADHQVHVRRERALLRPAPWWKPQVLVARELAAVRQAEHETAAAVVEAEHRVISAEAQERVARLVLLAAAGDWVMHLMERDGDAAAITSELLVIEQLEVREGLAAPAPPQAPALDAATLAALSSHQLERLELAFEDLAGEAERRRAALDRLRARAAHLVEVLERRVRRQAAVGLSAPLEHRRRERDRLVAWVEAEGARASVCRAHGRALEAARERVEALERARRQARRVEGGAR